jgi:hypothetical protein
MRLYAGVFAFLTCVGMASGALAWADQAGSANERPGVQFVSERPVQQWLKGVFERRRPSGEGMVRFDGLWWYGDYRLAMDRANALGRYMLIYFYDRNASPAQQEFETETLANPTIREQLRCFTCVRLPLDASIKIDGKKLRLLDDPTFYEMLGRPGIAIIDLANREADYHGCVVSCFPLLNWHKYTPDRMLAMLNLPAGTLTQRTLVYAVRVHPEGPASTQGSADPYVMAEATQHTLNQAMTHNMGHQGWGARYQRVSQHAGGGAYEVCVVTSSGECVVEGALDCMRVWRGSSPHWSSISRYHAMYGYDIIRSNSGAWYATGIFAGQ